MNRRAPNIDRLLKTLKGEIPDRVPTYEPVFESNIVSAILGHEAKSTTPSSRGVTVFEMPMSPADYRSVLEFTGMDFGYVEAGWTPLRYADHKGDLHLITDGRIKTLDDLDNVVFPSFDVDIAPRLEALRLYKKEFEGTGIGTAICLGSAFQCCYYFLCGFENFLSAFYDNLEYAEKMLDICFDYYTTILEAFLEEGIDLVVTGDDIAYKQGLFIKPQFMEDIWLPRYRKFIGVAKSAGKPMMFHSCGKVEDLFEDIILNADLCGSSSPAVPVSLPMS